MLHAAVVLLALAPADSPPADANAKAAVDYVRKLKFEGGYRPTEASREATLRATLAAVRAIKYHGGSIPDDVRTGADGFLRFCHDPASGGFADVPGGKPDPIATSVGLMLAGELGASKEPMADRAVEYLNANVREFEDIRMAAGALETVGRTSPKAADWLAAVAKLRAADGTYGDGPGRVRATGGAAALVLRLGGELPGRDAVAKLLRDGQSPDGGFAAAAGKPSDLETTYRVTRALSMLKQPPADPQKLLDFVEKCRNADGGYGVAPGQKSNVGGTYFAGILKHWLKELR